MFSKGLETNGLEIEAKKSSAEICSYIMDSVHYKYTVAPRALTSDEAMELRKLLKATLLIDNANQRVSMTTREQDEEDVSVLIDYAMHMVEDGRNVGHMSEEVSAPYVYYF